MTKMEFKLKKMATDPKACSIHDILSVEQKNVEQESYDWIIKQHETEIA